MPRQSGNPDQIGTARGQSSYGRPRHAGSAPQVRGRGKPTALQIPTLSIPPHAQVPPRFEDFQRHEDVSIREKWTRRSLIHGWIVGLGIFLMSRLQGNRPEFITDLMNRLDLPYHPRDLKLTRQKVTESLLTLRAQTRADQRWWSIIDAQEIGPEFIEAALRHLFW